MGGSKRRKSSCVAGSKPFKCSSASLGWFSRTQRSASTSGSGVSDGGFAVTTGSFGVGPGESGGGLGASWLDPSGSGGWGVGGGRGPAPRLLFFSAGGDDHPRA